MIDTSKFLVKPVDVKPIYKRHVRNDGIKHAVISNSTYQTYMSILYLKECATISTLCDLRFQPNVTLERDVVFRISGW